MTFFILNKRNVQIPIDFKFYSYNMTEKRDWAELHVSNSQDIIVKTKPNDNVIIEYYKRHVVHEGRYYPCVTYTLDLRKVIDFYEEIECGVIKNNQSITNFISNLKPDNHPEAVNPPKRVVPELPKIILEEFPYELETIISWAEKPYGLIVEYMKELKNANTT